MTAPPELSPGPYSPPGQMRRHIELRPVPEARATHVPPDAGPCWYWTGSVNSAGYGQLKFNGRTWNTHRLAYHLRVARLPLPGRARGKQGREGDGQDTDILDHLCEVRRCCNPAHLEKIDQSENVKRGARWRESEDT